ncbi:hypothetical protein K5549_021350, partial [Capra hircus]
SRSSYPTPSSARAGSAGVRGVLQLSRELIRGLEIVLFESRASRPQRGTEARALGGRRGGRVWGRGENGCQILAIWSLIKQFGFIAASRRGIRAGWQNFCDRFVGQQEGQGEEEGLYGQTLYTYPENWRAFKALIAAQYSGAQVRVLSAPPHFHFGQTNRTPEFLRKFPAGKVPAFEGDDGFCVFESNAIAYYVSNEELRGSTPEAAAQVVQWVSFADSDIVPPASTWVFPTLGIMHHNKQATENAKEEVRRILGLLDAHLKTRTFLVGERVTLADITVVCTLLWLYKQVLEPSFRQAFPNTNRWFLTCINQPQFRAVLGEVKLCEKMAQFDAKKFAESQPKKDTPRKEKGSREEKPKPQAERKEGKEEKKAAAPAPEEELDECEQALAAEPKAKDPFAHLPKSTFVLDEFKRKYSNEDTLSVALPYFWDHFDKDGWSLWYSEYRFPEELTQTFMSCNLITGMFQRLDKLRKNAFASVILFGTNNSSSISGVWVFRGQELAFPLSPDWQVDYESYTWRKLDPSSEETQTLVREYFCWEGAFQHVGKAFNQGKIFK